MVGHYPLILGNDQPFFKGHGDSRQLFSLVFSREARFLGAYYKSKWIHVPFFQGHGLSTQKIALSTSEIIKQSWCGGCPHPTSKWCGFVMVFVELLWMVAKSISHHPRSHG